MRLKSKFILLSVVFLLMGCTSDLDLKKGEISAQDLNKLIRQLEHGELYWDASGKAMSPFTIDMIGSVSYRNNAARLLGRLVKKGANVEKAVPALIKSLKPNRNEFISDYGIIPVRATSAHSLGLIKDRRAIDGLIELVKDSKQCLSATPAPHCEDFRSKECSGLTCKSRILEDVRGAIASRQSEAIIALGNIGVKRPDIVNLLMSELSSKSSEFKVECASALAKLEVDQAIDVLITRLQKDSSSQSDTANAIGKFGVRAQKAVPILIKKQAILALKEIGTPEAVNALQEFSKSSNPQISDSAKHALEDLKDGIKEEEHPWE
jgi:HEAT repeat protein